jgi:hypothetical protein
MATAAMATVTAAMATATAATATATADADVTAATAAMATATAATAATATATATATAAMATATAATAATTDAVNSKDAEYESNKQNLPEGMSADSNSEMEILARLAALENGPRSLTVHSIPLEQMTQLMLKFGSEGCQRGKLKALVSPNSTRRRFARYFPGFFRYFVYNPDDGSFTPRLGDEVELKRRELLRAQYKSPKRPKQFPKTRQPKEKTGANQYTHK